MITPGPLIRRHRLALGLSTRELALLAGVAYPTISRIENGHEQPRWDTMGKIASALGIALWPGTDARPVPRVADLARETALDRSGDTQPNWTRWRAFADRLTLHPELVGAAIASAPEPSGSPLIDNLIAAIAERLADDSGIRRPRWTRLVAPLETPWSAPGTPRMKAEHAASTPEQFAKRNITLPASAIWRDRELVRP